MAHDTQSFVNQVVAITGGARGLGLVLARHFGAHGAKVALLARDEAELARAEAELRGRGIPVFTAVCDVREREQCDRAIAEVTNHFGSVDVLVNNAGIIQAGPLEHMLEDDFADAMNTHFWGPYYLMQAVLPQMRRRRQGKIVNIASIGGRAAVPHMAPYSASKFALVGLSDAVRNEVAADGIRVTTVCPGLMRIGSTYNAKFKGQHEKEFTWFSIGGATPLLSIGADAAARQIVAATRRGSTHLTISVPAKLLGGLNGAFPRLAAIILRTVARFLPAPTGPSGDTARPGYESTSALAPSILTTLGDKAAVRNNEIGPESLHR